MDNLPGSSDLNSTRSLKEGDQGDVDAVVVQRTGEPLPDRVGRFVPLGELGKGGGGVVYLADDPLLNRRVAVKVPKREGPGAMANFLAEARAAAKLKHPHVIQIFDIGTLEDGRPFIAMEFASGGSLAARLRRRPMKWREAVETTLQVARALELAHHHRLLHRDLKPSNVLLDEHGQAKVADFGLSLSADERLLGHSGVTGTPAYMSPEQASGDVQRLDNQTDLWSLGVLLYETLTCRKPFEAKEWSELREQIQNAEPKSPREYSPKIPREVEQICLQCLRKKPEERPAGVEEISRVLQRALARRRISTRALAAMAMTVAVGAAGVWWGLARGRDAVVPQSLVAIPAPGSNWPEKRKLVEIPGRIDLLSIPGEVWMFDRSRSDSFLKMDPSDRELSLSSETGTIIAWPVKMPKSFRWTTRMNVPKETGAIQFCWNVHPATRPDGHLCSQFGYVSVKGMTRATVSIWGKASASGRGLSFGGPGIGGGAHESIPRCRDSAESAD